MRRLLLVLATLGLFAIPSSGEAQVSFGATAAYHDDVDFGLGAFAEVPVTALHENVSVRGDFTYFFPDVDGFDYFEINGNLHYHFPLADQGFTPFALGGLNVARASFDADLGGGFGSVSGSDTEVGLNLGGGLAFEAGSLSPAVGAKIELGGGEGFVLFGSLGIG